MYMQVVLNILNLVHKLVYDFFTASTMLMSSIYSSCDFVMAGVTNKSYLQ